MVITASTSSRNVAEVQIQPEDRVVAISAIEVAAWVWLTEVGELVADRWEWVLVTVAAVAA